jgi:hypothetical protein
LLGSLPRNELDRLKPLLRSIHLSGGHVLGDEDMPVRFVYFPTDCVASFLTLMRDGDSVEAASTGNEGFVGVSAFLGQERETNRWIIQI